MYHTQVNPSTNRSTGIFSTQVRWMPSWPGQCPAADRENTRDAAATTAHTAVTAHSISRRLSVCML